MQDVREKSLREIILGIGDWYRSIRPQAEGGIFKSAEREGYRIAMPLGQTVSAMKWKGSVVLDIAICYYLSY